jgi:ZIP family zinc transporter
LVIAITPHNFPEGLAVGVGYGAGDPGSAHARTIGIGLQNLPDGLAVAVARASGAARASRAVFMVALLTGMVEPISRTIG